MGVWAGNPCRLCLLNNSTIPIPNSPFYLYSIFDASGVKVSPEDDLPQQLCKRCYLFINQCNIFREKSQKAQKILLDLLNKRKDKPNRAENVVILEIPSNTAEILNQQQYEVKVQQYNTVSLLDENNTNTHEKLNSSADDSINEDNKDIFEGIADLNSDNINLCQDSDEIIQDLNSDNEDLNSDNENEDSEHLIPDNANLSSDNANLSDNLITHPTNISINNERQKYTISDDGKIAKCNECGKEMRKTSIQRHLKRHDPNRKVIKKGSNIAETLAECDICGSKMKKDRLLAHFLIHDLPDGKLVCKHCDKSFDRPFALLRHCRAKHGYKKVDKCSYCDFMGCAPYEVKVHEKQHKVGAFSCNVCGIKFKCKSFLSKHNMTVHTELRKQSHKNASSTIHCFKCPHCPHTSFNKATTRIHMKRKHDATNTQDIIKLDKRPSPEDTDIKVETKNEILQTLGVINDENNCQIIFEVDRVTNRVIQLGVDGSMEIVEGQNNENLISGHEQLESGHELLNHESEDLNSDNKVFNPENDNLNDENEFIHLDYERLGSISDENSGQHYKDLDQHYNDYLDYETLQSDIENLGDEELYTNENLNSGNEFLNLGNEHLQPDSDLLNQDSIDLKQDNKRKNTKTNNKLKGNKSRDKQTTFKTIKSCRGSKTKIDKKDKVKCNVCGQEMLRTSMYHHRSLHELYGDDLKKRFKNYKRKQACVCDTCGRKMSKNRLVAHFLKHDVAAVAGTLNCKHCGKTFERPSGLLRHCRSKHGYEKVDKCSLCDFMGNSAYDVKMHEKQQHKGGEPKTCEICGFSSKWKSSWLQHLAEHSKESPQILCTECPEKFHSKRQLRLHKLKRHNRSGVIRNFVCPHCPHSRVQRATIIEHMKKKHGANNIQDIKKVFRIKNIADTVGKNSRNTQRRVNIDSTLLSINSNSNELDTETTAQNRIAIKDQKSLNSSVDFLSAFHEHLESNNGDLSADNLRIKNLINELDVIINTNFEVVNEIFGTGDLNKDKDLSADRYYKCKDCEKIIQLQDVRRHFEKHQKQNLISTVCEHCGRQFKRKKELIRHLKCKHGYVRDHKCSYCDYRGADAYQIKVHEWKHTGEAPYPCSVCNKAFRYSSSLKEHMETHDKSLKETVECEICKKSIRKRYYPGHKKTHDPNYQPKQRPYVTCDVCSRSVQAHNLKEHLLRHGGVRKPIPCQHCKKTFPRRSALLRHCKASHGYQKTDKCQYCDFLGCSPYEVKVHEGTHTNLKPFTCNICDKSFRLLSSLQRHAKSKVVHVKRKKTKEERKKEKKERKERKDIHLQTTTKTVQLKCKECTQTFSTRRELSNHQYQAHSGSLFHYQCAICHQVYQKKDSARNHLVKIHKKTDCKKIIKLKLSMGKIAVERK